MITIKGPRALKGYIAFPYEAKNQTKIRKKLGIKARASDTVLYLQKYPQAYLLYNSPVPIILLKSETLFL